MSPKFDVRIPVGARHQVGRSDAGRQRRRWTINAALPATRTRAAPATRATVSCTRPRRCLVAAARVRAWLVGGVAICVAPAGFPDRSPAARFTSTFDPDEAVPGPLGCDPGGA